MTRVAAAVAGFAVCTMAWTFAAPPAFVDITWMSISNMYYELGSLNVVTDGYITRLPQDAFFGGGGGFAQTRRPFTPDIAAVTRVMNALGGPGRVSLLLTGHSHWDHSFDTATWSKLTGARIIGARTTCLQAQAEGVSAERCRSVIGGEAIPLAEGVTMRVVRWNHSGDPAVNPEQHNPVELNAVPVRDPATGGLRAGVAEDFPNGGGNRAYLFTVDGPSGRFSWFFNNSASAVDLHVPIVVDGVNYGAPLENLRSAMRDAKLTSVDLWIGGSAVPVAKLVVPVLNPRAFLPVHWDGLFGAFEAGVQKPYADAGVEAFLEASGVAVVKPAQYMDKWRLDRAGVRPIANTEVKRFLGSTKRVRALIFDFDGLIVDSEGPGFRAWSELYASYGCALPFDKYSACIGTIGGFDLHGYLQQQSGRLFELEDLENACNARWLELMKEQPLLPGIAACVASAKTRGLKLAVASSSTEEWVTGNLRKFGLLDRFDAICTRDYVASVKPDPALYLLALEKLGVAADEAIAFEDSPPGILAAKRAGIFCIAIPNPLTKNLPLELADRRLSSLEEFDLIMSNIVAIGGGGFLAEPRNLALEKYILEQTGKERPRVLMIPTARGDDAEYVRKFHAAFGELGATTADLPFFHRTPDLRALILAQDAIFVGGGNTKSMLAVWREWGVPPLLQEASGRGIVLGGQSAGAICWFEQGITDSWADRLRPLDCMSFLPGSCCPHYDGEVERRPAYHAYLESGDVKPGYAIEDGAAAHFRHGRLERVVSKRAGARAYYVSIDQGTVNERALDVTLLPAA